MIKIFNKLVRDKIPEIINDNNEVAVTRYLSDSEFKNELGRKLYEESDEVASAKTKDETLDELCDLLELIRAIAKINDKDLDDIIELADKKKELKGGFDRKIFLEKTYDKE